jgi:hypothetical protein
MKLLGLLLALSSATAFGQASAYTNFLRQTQQGTGVVWDMTAIAASGAAPSTLALPKGGSLFQLSTVNSTSGVSYLLDQKLVGAYLPKADIKITTGDPYTLVNRTRVDKPFSVDTTITDIIAAGVGVPDAATRVLREQHIMNYPTGVTALDPTVVTANTATAKNYISANGKTTVNFATSSLTASPDARKATGEEHFIVLALADGTIAQTQIASAKVIVFPVPSGVIAGVTSGAEYRYQLPAPILTFSDLYPGSTTSLMLYEGSAVGGTGTALVTRQSTETIKPITVPTDSYDVLNNAITKDGSYTLVMTTTSAYGTEIISNVVTFAVRRTISVNAMQVSIADGVQN